MTRRISRSQLVLAVAKATAWAGITLIDPNKLTGWRKHAYWLAMAGGTAAEVAMPMTPDDGIYRSPETTLGIAAGTGGIIYGAQDLLARSDAWSIGLLEKIGLKKPRAWAAAAVFASMLGSSILEAKTAPEAEEYDEERPDRATLEPLPEKVRAVIAQLLDAVDGYGSEELRAQLDGAVCRPEDGQFLLMADPEAPRTLLESYTFPATAIFERDGVNHILMLDIEEGQLAYLSHFVEPFQEDENAVDWSLPEVSELKIVQGFDDTVDAD